MPQPKGDKSYGGSDKNNTKTFGGGSRPATNRQKSNETLIPDHDGNELCVSCNNAYEAELLVIANS